MKTLCDFFFSIFLASNVLSWSNQCTVLVDEKAEFQTAKSIKAEANKTNRPRPTTISASSVITSPSAVSLVPQNEAPNIEEPSSSNTGSSNSNNNNIINQISSGNTNSGGKFRFRRDIENVDVVKKHVILNGVGGSGSNSDLFLFNHNLTHVSLHANSNNIEVDLGANYHTATKNISITTSAHTILHINQGTSSDTLMIRCENKMVNYDLINDDSIIVEVDDFQEFEITDVTTHNTITSTDNDDEKEYNRNLITNIDFITTSTPPEIEVEDKLVTRLIGKHSKRSSNDDGDNVGDNDDGEQLQNDDPRLIAYNNPEENFEFISLEDEKKKETDNKIKPILATSVPLEQPGVPHYVVHDSNTPHINATQQFPRILVNVSIATDHGAGTQTHAVYMLHVQVPTSIDLSPPVSNKNFPEPIPDNLILVDSHSKTQQKFTHNQNDKENEINTGTQEDYKDNELHPSINIRKTSPHPKENNNKKNNTILSGAEVVTPITKTTSSNSLLLNESPLSEHDGNNKDNFVFDTTTTKVGSDESNVVITTTESMFLSTPLSSSFSSVFSSSSTIPHTITDNTNNNKENFDKENTGSRKTVELGECNNHTIPYVLILEGEIIFCL